MTLISEQAGEKALKIEILIKDKFLITGIAQKYTLIKKNNNIMNYPKSQKKGMRLSDKAMRLEDKSERVADSGKGNMKRASRIMARSQKALMKSKKA